ncbi:glycosyltransferase [Auritidibacter ignavus]|uniref:glycosyltransferase n=1 Tax=Auritidibacter ignavus TaxID=678932 RepID=UPI0024BAC182|nr:glycosyltransferase [Auritidibacter ignavus]WHS28199.1 glycosyltransferase [Auritidibacter ignavus]
MLGLFRRFSRKQQLVVGFFGLVAVAATVLAFFIDLAILVVALFWLLALLAFVMVMFLRRLNAKIVRLTRNSVRRAGDVRGRVLPTAASNLSSKESLESLRDRFQKKPTVKNALPYANKVLNVQGNISEANSILDSVPESAVLGDGEKKFVQRVRSLHKLLDKPVELPQKHYTCNYLPVQNRILYAVGISPVSNSNGYTTRTQGIAQGLQLQGADVIVAPLPGKPWDRRPSTGFKVPQEKRRYQQQINGVHYVHNPGLKSWEGDIGVFLQVSADAYVREAMIDKPEVIVSASNYLTALPALMAARRLGVPFVYEMRGFWEVTAASKNPAWAGSEKYALDRRLEFQVASEADHVVVITEEMKDDLVERGVNGDNISVAANSVDIDKFFPQGKDLQLLKKLGFSQPELPVVGFAGSVTEYEGLDLVVDALSAIQEEGDEFNFLVIGGGSYLPELKKRVSEAGLEPRTRYLEGIPNANMPTYLSSIDIFPLARKSLPVTELVSPLKPLEAMAVGRSVVLSDVSPHRAFYGTDEDKSRALSFAKDSVPELKEQLHRLIRNPELREQLGVRARRWVRENRTWKQTGEIYWSALQELLRSQSQLAKSSSERPLDSYTVAFIGDTFTSETFLPELTAIRVTPDDWREQFAHNDIDAVFIESAWQGNDKAWEGIIGYYDDASHAPIANLIDHAQEHGIPVMFWNKEDPVHYNRFKRTAARCDYVFTTDARTIVDYNAEPDNRISAVASAPFAAQPILHNPLPSTREREDTIAYGGTYYGDKYATRKQGLDFLFYESAPYGLAIYERVHNDPNSPYRLPDRFRRYARQSLSYPEMCQAYKAHPIHLNGNSVVDSPSMFSRRVVEITASGSSVLSSPGRGVDETFAGTVPTVENPDEANSVLKRWKSSEEARHKDLWKALRHVYEAHTCAHRLVYMMRVAGFLVRAPKLHPFAVECSASDIPEFEKQSVRPDMYLIDEEFDGQDVAGQVIVAPTAQSKMDALRENDIRHVVKAANSIGTLSRNDVEDLLNGLTFGDWKAVGKQAVSWSPGNLFVPVATCSAAINSRLVLFERDTYAQILEGETATLDDEDVFAWQIVRDKKEQVDSTKTAVTTSSARNVSIAGPDESSPTVLIAGHDFKFFIEIMNGIQKAGHRVRIDRWGGHSIHDEQQSRRLLDGADVIFCEWSLGNLVWYSQNKLPGQKLITRVHAQELRTKFLDQAILKNVDAFIFVSPVGMRRAQVRYGIPTSKSFVIGNTFDMGRFLTYRSEINPKNIGFVGSVPQSKRFDRALDIIEQLASKDQEYKLIVKGKEYTEYPWLQDRPAEQEYFQRVYERIESSPVLKDAVVFDGHSPDLAEWYTTVPGFILSTSDHEGTHQVVAEGGAAGCVPVILPWAGAEQVYGTRWLVDDIDSAVQRIRSLAADPQALLDESYAVRDYMHKHFRPGVISGKILRLIES